MVETYKVKMKLRILNVKKIDFMQYKCVAKNALGYSDGTITLYREYTFLIEFLILAPFFVNFQ